MSATDMKIRNKFRKIRTTAPFPRTVRFKNILTGEILRVTNLYQFSKRNFPNVKLPVSLYYLANGKISRYRHLCLPSANIKPVTIFDTQKGKYLNFLNKREMCLKLKLNQRECHRILSLKQIVNNYCCKDKFMECLSKIKRTIKDEKIALNIAYNVIKCFNRKRWER